MLSPALLADTMGHVRPDPPPRSWQPILSRDCSGAINTRRGGRSRPSPGVLPPGPGSLGRDVDPCSGRPWGPCAPARAHPGSCCRLLGRAPVVTARRPSRHSCAVPVCVCARLPWGPSRGLPLPPGPGSTAPHRSLPGDRPQAPRAGGDPLRVPGPPPSITAVRHRGIWPHVKVGWPRAGAGGEGAGGGHTWMASRAGAGPSCISESIRGLILPWCCGAAGPKSPSPGFPRLSPSVPQAAEGAEPLLGLAGRDGGPRPLCVQVLSGSGGSSEAGERARGDPRQGWAPASPGRTRGAAAQPRIPGDAEAVPVPWGLWQLRCSLHGGGWESGAAPAARPWCWDGGCGARGGSGTTNPATALERGHKRAAAVGQRAGQGLAADDVEAQVG